MRCVVGLLVECFAFASSPAVAQEPPPPIGPFVIDLHGTFPRFPSDSSQLALSRGLSVAQLPGSGLGVQASAHLYFLRLKAITFGIGAEVATGRASQTPDPTSTLAPTEEHFSTFSPQLS